MLQSVSFRSSVLAPAFDSRPITPSRRAAAPGRHDPAELRSARVAPIRSERPAPAKLSGRAWIAASRFVARSQSETLKAITEQVRLAAELARRTGTPPPVVIYDLDGTLFDNRFRTVKILEEWLEQVSATSTAAPEKVPAAVREAFLGLRASSVAYDLPSTFERLGLSLDAPGVRAALESATAFWKARFFTSAYCRYDRPHLGAIAYAAALRDAGATTVYLTGRDEPNMGEGTREALRAAGFPAGHLILKDRFETPDADFKERALPAIRRRGPVIATFDNEPANVVVFANGFAAATHVFVDTDYSNKAVEITDGLSWVADFRP